MRSPRLSKKLTTRMVSIVICITLALCTVLSFGILYSSSGALAAGEGESTSATVKDVNGIRFVQVAAGADFAIGLTYDGRLYGWSLIGSAGQTSPGAMTAANSTLGHYYSSTPKEINVKFRRGPGADGTTDWGNEDTRNGYHAEYLTTDSKPADSIVSIAATRTTAAFVTKGGYIYTWGVDKTKATATDENIYFDELEGGSQPHYLLLRPVDAHDNWYEPYIIDYNYYGDRTVENAALPLLIPSSTSTVNNMSIAAAEYNYIVSYQKGASGSQYNTYVWGSLMYSVSQMPSSFSQYGYYAYAESNASRPFQMLPRAVYQTGLTTAPTVVGGGYNVGINSAAAGGGTSLQLRGRNFLTSQYSSSTGFINTTTAVSEASQPVKYSSAASAKDISNGVIGGVGGTRNNGTIPYAANYYGRQSGSYNYALGSGVNKTVGVYGSQDQTSVLTGDNQAVRYEVALGNDVGYGIVGGALYGWGDDTYGQLLGKGGTNKYSSSPTTLGLSNVISIAAGKQKSADAKAYYMGQSGVSVEPLTYNGSDAITGFNNAVKNDSEFITGALLGNGSIVVWSDKITTQTTIKYDNSSEDVDKFIAVYSGYGHNLFAVTNLGKLVRITIKTGDTEAAPTYSYDVEYYDNFVDKDGTSENWAVNSGNVVTFTAPKAQTNEDGSLKIIKEAGKEQGTVAYYNYASVTFSVWGATKAGVVTNTPAEGETAVTLSGDAAFNGDAKEYFPLVSKNRIGDSYRIITQNLPDSKKFLSGGDTTPDFKPVYMFGDTKMTEAQQQNMFSAVISANGDITITPKQSSKGQTITMEFYVARLNHTDSFVSEGSSGDKGVYYDYKKCSIKFTINDTPSQMIYDAFMPDTGSGDDVVLGNSNIPLLDPNNDYNKYYSLAVQDVSTGFEKLGDYLGVANFASSVQTQILTAENVEGRKDPGFPASINITSGSLNYYLGATTAAKKYNNRYQYLFDDQDSDRIEVNVPSAGLMSGTATGSVLGEKKTIALTVPISGVADTKLTNIATDFNNKYGLYDITVNTEKTAITFKYDVLMFTAVLSSGNITYAESKVDGYATTRNTQRMSATITSQTVLKYSDTYAPLTGTGTRTDLSSYPAFAAVFSMPSLRLNSKYTGGTVVEGGNGATIEIDYSKFADVIYVGTEVQIDVKDFFTLTSAQRTNFSQYIGFSYENVAGGYDAFNKQFIDGTGNNKEVVTLSKSLLKIAPTTSKEINLDLTIQRFTDTNGRFAFADGKEKVTVHLVFPKTLIRDFEFKKGTVPSSVLLTKNETIDLFAKSGSYNESRLVTIENVSAAAISELESNVVIRELQYTEDGKTAATRLFTATIDESDKTKIRLSPVRSGTGMIQFVATVYGKSLFFSIPVNVSKETTISDENDPIIVVDDQYISVDDIKNKLVEANSFNPAIKDYQILFDDVKDAGVRDADKNYNAIVFYNAAGEDIGGFPPFIKNVIFEGKTSKTPMLRIISNNSSVTGDSVYYMHVKFTSASNPSYAEAAPGTVTEAILAVKSGKKSTNKLATINCRHPESTDWYTVEGSGLSTKVTVSLSALLDAVEEESATNYDAFLVSSDTSTANYFNYSVGAGSKTVIIEPLDNTEKGPCTVSVSASYGRNYIMVSFEVSVDGILTKLPVMTDDEGTIGYGNIWIYSFAIVFGVLAIIFLVRLIVYWKKRAKQRAIIKRNQELIRMRDRMHNKASIASKEQVVKTKLKMDDPKYAKMFNEMRKNKENESGVILENSDLAATASAKVEKNKKKKKGGKKTVAELKAELEAKKAAFAAAQAQNAQPVNPFGGDMPMGGDFGAPVDGFAEPVQGFGGVEGDFGGQQGDFGGATVFEPTDGGSEIIFDASDMGDGV